MTASSKILRLAADNGRRVGRTSKAMRHAAQPGVEVARLTRCLARVRAEAEQALAHAERAEAMLNKAFGVACGDDRDLMLAMMRHACVEASLAYRFRGLIRSLEMAEEGTLCA